MLLVMILVGLAVSSDAAPRSKSKAPQLVYDQKQHGDYNIQVHLKDFQIIALLGEESLGGLGDYDYNYDYADFTVKPSGSNTSQKPPQDISTISTTKAPEISSTVNNPPKDPSTLKPDDEDSEVKISTTSKPLAVSSENLPGEAKPSTEIVKDETASSTETISETTKKGSDVPDVNSIPGQIQVQVIHSAEGYPNMTEEKNETKISTGKSNDKKCSTGFSRDKRGRCRRLRRPQNALPFNFGRLANLASRFRSTDDVSPPKLSRSN